MCSQKGHPLFPFSPKGEKRTSQVNPLFSQTAASPPRNYTKQDILYNSGENKSKRLCRLVVFRASATLNYRARFAEILCKSNPYKILQCFVQFRYGYKVSGYYSIIKTLLLSHYFRLTVAEKADIMKEHRTGKPVRSHP